MILCKYWIINYIQIDDKSVDKLIDESIIGNILDLNGILPLNAIVNVSVSAGLEQSLDVSTFAGQEEGIIYFETQKLVDYLASKSLSFVNNTQTTYCLLKINDIQVDNTFYLNNIDYKEGWKIEISEYPATLE